MGGAKTPHVGTGADKPSGDDVERLVKAVHGRIPVETWPKWLGGYPDAIEPALLDAVFSMQARYSDDPDRGPRGVVNRWIGERREVKPDDLSQLAKVSSKDLQRILGNSSKGNRGRTLKSDLARSAASALVEIGVSTSTDLCKQPTPKDAGRAWTSVTGLGWVTFEYFCMLLGRPGVKADVMIRRFVSDTLEIDDIQASQARRLMEATAEKLEGGVNLTDLDHAIWKFQSGRWAPEPDSGGA